MGFNSMNLCGVFAADGDLLYAYANSKKRREADVARHFFVIIVVVNARYYSRFCVYDVVVT